jgi:hypothetical protein
MSMHGWPGFLILIGLAAIVVVVKVVLFWHMISVLALLHALLHNFSLCPSEVPHRTLTSVFVSVKSSPVILPRSLFLYSVSTSFGAVE